MNTAGWIPLEIIARSWETSSLVYLKTAPQAEGARIDFRAGQLIKILSPQGHESIFALAGESEEKRFTEFLIKDHETGAAHELCRLQVGDQIKVGPPFGRGYPLERLKNKDLLLVGMGSALAPLRSLLKSVLRRDQQFGKITFLYGARTPEDIPLKKEFDVWAKKIDLRFTISCPGSSTCTGFLGRVTGLLPQLSFDPHKTIACICGTKKMQEEVTNLLETTGFSKENVLTNY